MTLSVAVITTFGNQHYEPYAEQMLRSFVTYWPPEIPIMVKLDDGSLHEKIDKVLRPTDGLQSGMEPDHEAFVERHKGKDDQQNYRKQAVRFCHKVFALKYALDAIVKSKADKMPDTPRHLIWLDADVLTTRKVSPDDILKCLPQEGDAVSYLGRKDWEHSECGWLAFDLDNGGDAIINAMHAKYIHDSVFALDQWHDSYVFDQVSGDKKTNLTPDATGMEVWPQSPMASWSKHYKGPIAKQELAKTKEPGRMQPLRIETKNSIPDESIKKNIIENQTQITQWVAACTKTDEEIVVVSAGPMLVAEDLLDEIAAGRKIVAVKHALTPLKEAGIKPWACILLDPREHVTDFVENPDKDILWLVASQVTPKAVKKLLDAGCNVWGYHAAVGAGEAEYTVKQQGAVIEGGSATATRGLFLLERLGFRKLRLYGYDLCFGHKPNLSDKDEYGQPKHFEIEMSCRLPHYSGSRWFWSKGELLAQADEFRQILESKKFEIKAYGVGIGPFLSSVFRVNDLRQAAKMTKISGVTVHHEDLFKCKNRTQSLTPWRKMLPQILLSRMQANNS